MSEKELSPLESIELIRNMIDKTKEGIYDRSSSFLLWGWGTFLACLAQFILKVVFNYPYHYAVWLITFVLLGLNFILIRNRSKEPTKTYVKEAMGFLWMGIGISFFIISVIFSKIGWQYCYPFFIMFYGLGTFISGKLLKFKPLVVGGVISWVLAVTAVYFRYDYQMLFTCTSLLISYIIPGHMLRAEYQKSNRLRVPISQ